MSRWSTWSRGQTEKPSFLSDFMKEAMDTGNPAVLSSPAERARQLGLQSDGSGGYVDPETGQVVARTVNGELVFYDNRGASGGAVSDGAGGAQLANAQPTWSDPMTGLAMTPPSRPESPEEQMAVPDPIPATAPAGYDTFISKQKATAYGRNETADVNNPRPAAPQQGINPIGPDGNVNIGPTPMGEEIGDNKELRAKAGMLPKPGKTFDQMRDQIQKSNIQQQNTPTLSKERQRQLISRLSNVQKASSLSKGAGANALSLEDIGKFRNYIKNGPQNETEDVTDDELDFAMNHLKGQVGKKWTGFQNRLKGKGDPEPSRKVVSRAGEVLRSYLMNFGQSAIDGEILPFSDSELDHGISLSNGGLDQADNWRWLPKRYNQFKGDLSDEDLLSALEKEEERQNNPDYKIKQQEDEFINQSRSEWKDRFDTNGWENMNVADIREKKGAAGMQFLKALAEKAGVSYYKNRPGARSSGRAGGGTSLGVQELQDRLIDELGIPDTVDVENFDRGLFDVLQSIEDKRSELDSAKRARRREKRELKKRELKRKK